MNYVNITQIDAKLHPYNITTTISSLRTLPASFERFTALQKDQFMAPMYSLSLRMIFETGYADDYTYSFSLCNDTSDQVCR